MKFSSKTSIIFEASLLLSDKFEELFSSFGMPFLLEEDFTEEEFVED